MEAPEKIYIDDPTGDFDDHWSVYKNNDSIEYTRTDAFIEKACKYISSHQCEYIDFDDFKNYMKGDKL